MQMTAPGPEHDHTTYLPTTASFQTRPAHTTIGWWQDRRPVVSKLPLHINNAAKMSLHICICQEPVLTVHARSPSAAGSHCPARADSAPHSEQNFSHGPEEQSLPRGGKIIGITRSTSISKAVVQSHLPCTLPLAAHVLHSPPPPSRTAL
jgi:hypothetical protein